MGLQRIQNAFIVHPWLRNTSGSHTFSALPQNQKQHKEKLRVRSYGPPAPGSNVYDEYSVRRLCTILADNAIKHALPGTEIFFSLKKAKKGVVITTVNECDHLNNKNSVFTVLCGGNAVCLLSFFEQKVLCNAEHFTQGARYKQQNRCSAAEMSDIRKPAVFRYERSAEGVIIVCDKHCGITGTETFFYELL